LSDDDEYDDEYDSDYYNEEVDDMELLDFELITGFSEDLLR